MQLGSYYDPGLPGVGAYYWGGQTAPLSGAESSLQTVFKVPASVGEVTSNLKLQVVSMLVSGVAGYFVGKKTGMPVATAVASGLFGIPGMFAATLYASSVKQHSGGVP